MIKPRNSKSFDQDSLGRNESKQLVKEGKSLSRARKFNEAIEKFEDALKLSRSNKYALTAYAETLAMMGKFNDSFQRFEQSLKIDPHDVITLTSYANARNQYGEYDHALQLIEQALKIKPSDAITLNLYAGLLSKKGDTSSAVKFYARSLKVNPNNPVVLTEFANLCLQIGNNSQATDLLEKALALQPDNMKTLITLTSALIKQGEIDRTFKLLDQALQVDPKNVVVLSQFANLLIQKGDHERASQLLDQALQLDPKNIVVLSQFAHFLIQEGDHERASQLLKEAIFLEEKSSAQSHNRLQSVQSYNRLQYAKHLEKQERYEESIDQLLMIDLSQSDPYHAAIIRLHLGRLYYLLNQPENGKRYIDEAISKSDHKDKSRLYAARCLLVANPRSEEAISILQEIEASSPQYDEAIKTIALNADSKTAYELFAGDEENFGNTEILYRAIYHKIGNEVAILKSIAYRLLRKIENLHPIVREIIDDLDALQASINTQRAAEKAAIADIPRDNYQQLIETVSKTAHDIADEVNNILATIESKTRRTLRKITNNSSLFESLEKLLAQLELTQNALNDLKSINEGMVIRKHRFPIHKLFEKWEPSTWSNRPRLLHATISLKLENSNSEFNGDEEKIKSIINELVENSLKHNPNIHNLSIWMTSRDLLNPPDVGMPTIPGDRRYLFIQISDNGKGIPSDKKEWIFQPLNTTSPEEQGSGLGLFIARKTLQKMGGYIREVGENGKGVKFELYIPYFTQEDM